MAKVMYLGFEKVAFSQFYFDTNFAEAVRSN